MEASTSTSTPAINQNPEDIYSKNIEPNLKPVIDDINIRLKSLENKTKSSELNTSMGGFFGGSNDGFNASSTTTKLYTGPVSGGKGKKTRRHKNKRHSYSRKSKKGLKNKLKRLFGLKGGEGEGGISTLPEKPLDSISVGGTTNVKSPL